MRRSILTFLCILFLGVGGAHAVGNKTITPMPSEPPTSNYRTEVQTFFEQEDAARQSRTMRAFVYSGGLHGTSVTLVSPAFATEAFDNMGNRNNQASATIDYATVGCAATDTAWVLVSSRVENALDNFQRVSGTDYFVDCVNTSLPVVPVGSILLMKVTMAAGAITAVGDMRQDNPNAMVANLRSPMYGAVGDCVADDTVAVQRFINNVSWRRITGYMPQGCYKITRVWFSYDVVNNPMFPSDLQFQGNVAFEGAGAMQVSNAALATDRKPGTVFVSTTTDAPMFNGAGDHVNFAFKGLRLKGFSLEQTTSTHVVNFEDLHSRAYIEELFIIQRGTGGGMLWTDVFLIRMQDSFIYTNNALNTGHGLQIYNVSNIGGIVELANVTGRGFIGGRCIQVGSTVDLEEDILASVSLIGVQGQACQVGIAVYGAISGGIVQGGYTEGTSNYGLEISNNALGVAVIGGYYDAAGHEDATDAAIKIGASTGGILDRAQGVVIQSARLFRVDAGYGIFRDFSSLHTVGTVIQGVLISGTGGTGIYCGTGGAAGEDNLVIQGNGLADTLAVKVDPTCRSGEIVQDDANIYFGRRVNMSQGLIASATNIVLPGNGNAYNLTGSATVTTITCTQCISGAVITFFVQALNSPVIAEGGNIFLENEAGDDAFEGAGGAAISLLYDGTAWRELFRSNTN